MIAYNNQVIVLLRTLLTLYRIKDNVVDQDQISDGLLPILLTKNFQPIMRLTGEPILEGKI